MATQENIAISPQLFAAENATVTLVSEKERKKQREELAHLAAALKTVTDTVASAKAGVAAAAATKEGDKVVALNPSDASADDHKISFEDAMVQFAVILAELQVNIAKYSQDKAAMDATNSRSQVALVQEQVKELQDQLAKINAANEKQKTIQTVEKVVSWFIAIASAIAAVVTLQPELFIITALSIASATGAMSEATKGISTLLQKMGMSKEVADIVAAAIVVVVVTAATLGAGAATAAPEVVADEAVDAIAEAGEEAAAEAGESAAADSGSALQKIGSFLTKYNPFSALGRTTNLTILAAAQSVASTGLVNNIAEEIMVATKTPEEKRKEVEMWISIAVSIASILVTLGASAGAMASSTAKVATEVTSLGMKLATFSKVAYEAGNLAQGATGGVEGGFSIYQGFNEKELADINAFILLIRNCMEMNNTQIQSDQKYSAEEVKNQKLDGQSISHLMDGEAAIARALCTQA